jgi:CRISPR-associated endonuclease/helicase Cas3
LVDDDAAWQAVWAKTSRDDQQRVTHWLPLHEHLADTSAVAGFLVDRWVSPQVLAAIARDIDGDAEDVRGLAVWLAAVHDVGKASPAFAVQDPTLADAMRRHGLVARPVLAIDPKRSAVGHQLVGQVAVRDWLQTELGFPRRGVATQLAAVVGSHHGVPATNEDLLRVADRQDLAGAGEWELARGALLDWAAGLVGGREALARYKLVRLGKPSQVLLTAVVIMADWIASNAEYFPLDPLHTAHEPPRPPDPARTARRAAAGWRALDLPQRWVPQPLGADISAVFATRFGRGTVTARPVQVAAVEAAHAMERPGMVVVEAPMGEGKTEAALLAAEALAARSGADGCFVALPTRATSDAMFARVHRWLKALPGLPPRASVTLAHGTASLNDEFAGLLAAGRGEVSCVGEDGDEASVAHYWLRGRKKGPLAQFVIGTIDQVLFAGLKSRHLMLRHLALAGKVVIIDEVHAYDVYMSEYLDRVLHWLGAYGVPVVLLSATLPAARRAALMQAYDSGRGDASPQPDTDPGYPVVLASGLAPRAVPASAAPTPVALERCSDGLDELVALLRDRLADGGCAVVVRNTVGRVQETADRIVAEFGDEHVTVNHSRFLACDRARTDKELLRRFGPPGPDVERPDLHIVVASQVVEQSLDVDFDLMVTDLAPVDLVLQRIGRLHRHRRDRPPRLRDASCVLVGVEDWAAAPVQAVAGSRHVYSEHALLRSAALLLERDVIELPGGIAPLVQRGYGAEPVGPPQWQEAADSARLADEKAAARRRDGARAFLLDEVGGPKATLVDWVAAGVGDADDDPRGVAQVRDGGESLEVLVVVRDRDGGLLTPDWIERGAATQIPLDHQLPPKLARVVAACALRLPFALCHERIVGQVISALERNHFAGFEASPLLKGCLVLVLDPDRTAELQLRESAFRLTYDPRRGLLHEPI